MSSGSNPEPTPTPAPGPTSDPAPAPAASRPDWAPEKYWDPAKNELRIEDLAKGYQELSSTLGKRRETWETERLAKRPEAVDKYVPPKIEGLPEDFIQSHPLLPVVREIAYEHGLDQAGFEGLSAKVVEALAAAGPKPEDEIKKLGENAETRIAALSHWVDQNVTDADEKNQVALITTTAAGVRFLERLVAKADGRLPDPPKAEPAAPGAGTTGEFSFDGMTKADVRKLMDTPAYYDPRQRDPKVHQRVSAWFEAAERR